MMPRSPQKVAPRISNFLHKLLDDPGAVIICQSQPKTYEISCIGSPLRANFAGAFFAE